jgi:hypothetical protein
MRRVPQSDGGKLATIHDKLNQKSDITQVVDLGIKLEKAVGKLRDQCAKEMSKMEKSFDEKIAGLTKKFMECERKSEEKLAHISTQMAGLDATTPAPSWSEMVSKTDIMYTKLVAMAAEMQHLQKQTSDIQLDQVELEEHFRRKKWIIVQGLQEAGNSNPGDRKQADLDSIEGILHHINCDTISVNSCYRLGKCSDDPAKSRPIKLILASETQKQLVLKSAKTEKSQ